MRGTYYIAYQLGYKQEFIKMRGTYYITYQLGHKQGLIKIRGTYYIADKLGYKQRFIKMRGTYYIAYQLGYKQGFINMSDGESVCKLIVNIWMLMSLIVNDNIRSAFLSNQSFVNVVCRLLNAAKVETNTSFNHRVTDPVLPENMHAHVVGK